MEDQLVDDDEPLTLSPWASAALQEFYAEQELKRRTLQPDNELGTNYETSPSENWQLSQFWYDEPTATVLAKEALRLAKAGNTIACVSCPTVYRKLRQLIVTDDSVSGCDVRVRLFEYDKRFEQLAGNEDFVYYDYNEPLRNIPNDCRNACCLVIADPPFLSEECLAKTLETVASLANDKVILCTGAIMEDTVLNSNINLKLCKFEPCHAKKLANEFKCFANYDFDLHINITK